MVADLVVQLGGERTRADARRVRLGNAQTFFYCRGTDARARAEAARYGVRACDKRIRSAVEV